MLFLETFYKGTRTQRNNVVTEILGINKVVYLLPIFLLYKGFIV